MIDVKETKPGHFDINCECGKPITKSNKYGMFCEDFCNLEESKIAAKKLAEILENFTGLDFSEFI